MRLFTECTARRLTGPFIAILIFTVRMIYRREYVEDYLVVLDEW